MGCNFCDSCSDCTVGDALDCGMWEPEEHRNSDSNYDYDGSYDYCEDADDEVVSMSASEEQHCVKCGAAARLDWNYCLACGAPLPEKHCVKCGGKVADEWSHCPRCGSLVPSSYEGVPAPPSPIAPPSIRPSADASVSVYDDDIPF